MPLLVDEPTVNALVNDVPRKVIAFARDHGCIDSRRDDLDVGTRTDLAIVKLSVERYVDDDVPMTPVVRELYRRIASETKNASETKKKETYRLFYYRGEIPQADVRLGERYDGSTPLDPPERDRTPPGPRTAPFSDERARDVALPMPRVLAKLAGAALARPQRVLAVGVVLAVLVLVGLTWLASDDRIDESFSNGGDSGALPRRAGDTAPPDGAGDDDLPGNQLVADARRICALASVSVSPETIVRVAHPESDSSYMGSTYLEIMVFGVYAGPLPANVELYLSVWPHLAPGIGWLQPFAVAMHPNKRWSTRVGLGGEGQRYDVSVHLGEAGTLDDQMRQGLPAGSLCSLMEEKHRITIQKVG